MKTVILKSLVMMTVVSLSLALFSCKKDNVGTDTGKPLVTETGTPTGEVSGASIGTSGGTLTSTDGNITVAIPAGALTATTAVSIQPITNEAPLGLGFGYRLLPEGTTFSKPVTITFHYNDQVLNHS